MGGSLGDGLATGCDLLLRGRAHASTRWMIER